ncbi:TadA family conjugal transfer-associated ATPase [Nocardioides sp. zg-536]|uniref:TadA family conjugal transfer-associated ATPase n=1 Tax=Nocardioides faecalis TaxID=2803858 RepID=A0A938YB66_9ACTN|nr:TadA family conjugal transfer-associated ATPase [Nocardioides faecalis]MBM9461145.1 TadA family conjugal transfer-associated ATPase [Nocardioides faecalis]MBS4752201.1 TadA family conjugal transfer-associated ATPase [Nocardioides faecalis]QVI58998.1 TadA family conjugal transfer-associated ATPase [Nocardioides faecalis]
MIAGVPAGLVEEVRRRLAAGEGTLTPHRVAEALRAAGRPVGDATVLAVYEALHRDVAGAGVLEPLLRLPGVSDVLVNGPGPVRIDRGSGLEETDVVLPDEDACRRLAQRLVATGGRRVDDAAPWADVRLPDGTRCHAVLAPLAQPGTAISLRVPRRGGFTLDELAAAGALGGEGRELLGQVVDARLAFLVSGGTGTGKTTLLAAMLGEVPAGERIVVVEDAAELRPDHPQVVGLEARPANLEGAGAVLLRDLVRQALRMRPDRLVVGEVRDAAVVDLLAAMNTGHEGGCGTLHANSAADVPARVEALALTAGLGREAAHSQLVSALDVVLHVVRERGTGRRRLAQVAVLQREPAGTVRTVPAATFDAAGVLQPGPGARRLIDLLDGRR